MVAIVLATAYFAMAWLGLSDKLAVLADHVKRVSKRMFDVPDFFFYAIADGLRTLFSRHGRWNGLDGPDETPEGHLRAKYIDPTVIPDRPPIAIKNKHKTI